MDVGAAESVAGGDTDRRGVPDCVPMSQTIAATADSATSVAAFLAVLLVRSGAIV
jgi:hypothetical protein